MSTNQNQKRHLKGTKDGGQFAPDVNAESTVDLSDSNDDDKPVVNRETRTFGDHTYQFEKTEPENDVTKYTLTNPDGGGGWRFEYDSLTRRVKARGVRPTTMSPSEEWRDKGEADIRTVVRTLEPNAKLIDLDGDVYLIGGESFPLSKSELSGISTGEMMMIGGKSEDDLREYVAQQRSDTDRSESERPDMAASFAETRRYLDGIELAADIGSDAAVAGTVGAMNERFDKGRKPAVSNSGVKMVKCADCQAEIHPLDVFPKGRCIDCHAAVTPMPTAQDVRRAWGIS